VLTGQLNGRELEASAFFGDQDDTGGADVADTGAYSGYTTWTDEYSAIQLDLPNEWVDVNGANWESDGDIIGSSISGAADLENYIETWNESGVFFGASDDLAKLGGYVNLLDVERDIYRQYCKLEGRYDYSDALYRGKYDLYSNCDGSGNAFITLSAVPNDNSQAFLILVEMNITKEADYDALDQILATFQVVGHCRKYDTHIG
jgi:serine protease Do